jgi:HAD superfamily hydrolase (TIGR01484 family)
MNVDLIALDLDDTLLGSGLEISAANRAALAEARDSGIRIVLASGRNIHSMRDYVESASGRIIEERRLSPELCVEAARAIEAHGYPWQVYEHGVILVSRLSAWSYEDSRLTGQMTILIEDRGELFAQGLTKFVIPGEPEGIEALRRELTARFAGRATVVTSKPYFLEILALGVDKGTALARLAARLGVPMGRVMAVGDAMNDLAMVREAGWGCAPANATAEVKAAARVVSERSNDEDAVADLVGKVAFGR